MKLIKVTANREDGRKIVHITRCASHKVARDRLVVAYPDIANMKARTM